MEKRCHDWPVGRKRVGLALVLIAPAVLCVSVCIRGISGRCEVLYRQN